MSVKEEERALLLTGLLCIHCSAKHTGVGDPQHLGTIRPKEPQIKRFQSRPCVPSPSTAPPAAPFLSICLPQSSSPPLTLPIISIPPPQPPLDLLCLQEHSCVWLRAHCLILSSAAIRLGRAVLSQAGLSQSSPSGGLRS
uniref:Uncharacterized protein n=1 Tax=Knipowitschia caucasica TaxID=637954 RepID=A0AAV2MSG0_KNICA